VRTSILRIGGLRQVVSEPRTISLLSVAEKREISQPCHREEEIGQCLIQQWKGKCAKLRARLDAMETTQRHTVNARDVSEAESENEAGNEGEEVAAEDAADEPYSGLLQG
jgi:hypothetical protein